MGPGPPPDLLKTMEFVAHYSDDMHPAEMAQYQELRGRCNWTRSTFQEFNDQHAAKGSSVCYTRSGSKEDQEAKREADKAYGWTNGNDWDLLVNPECPGSPAPGSRRE